MTEQFAIPEKIARTVEEYHGAAGAGWVERLPSLLAAYAERWQLRLSPPFPNLWYNYVAPAVRANGEPVILKAGFPGGEHLTEIEALRLYDGRGMVRLLEADVDQGVFLLERLEPGVMLLTMEDDARATSIAASIMRELWRPVPVDHPFPTVADWANRGMTGLRAEFGGGTGPFPAGIVEEAERLFAELLSSQEEQVLLHGDLHHENILSATRAPWLAIDPKGVVGEPAYETSAWLRNPRALLSFPNVKQTLTRRIDQFAEELGFERARIRDWSLAHAVLSAWWSYEDGGDGWQSGIEVAQHLASIRV